MAEATIKKVLKLNEKFRMLNNSEIGWTFIPPVTRDYTKKKITKCIKQFCEDWMDK